MSTQLAIKRMGAKGEGVADTPDGPVYVPFTLPGERVTAARNKDRADLIAVLEPSADRVEPTCRHFGTCGGCALQHWQTGAYRAWKSGLVATALARRGIEAALEPMIICPPGSRRRAVFSALVTQDSVLLGFNQALSNTIVPINECPVADQRIVNALPALRDLAAIIGKKGRVFHLSVALGENGLDVAATGCGEPSDEKRRRAIAFVLSSSFARFAVDGEIIVEPRKPIVMFGDVAVTPPPVAFLQAATDSEEAMVGLVADHFAKAKRVMDLFAGCGTFALRLAKTATVHAIEADKPSLAALERGFRQGPGLKTVTCEQRDLFQRPLLPRDLIGFDAVVFDPPRAGADAQCRQLIRSEVLRIAAVSCNPGTLARDLRILIDGGYRLTSVTPIDQFVYSPHVEVVALLEKPKKRR